MMGNPSSAPLKQVTNPISSFRIAPSPPWKTGTTWQPRPRPTRPLPCLPSRSPPARSADPQKPPRRTGRTQHRFDSLGVNDQRFSIVFPHPKDFPFLLSSTFPPPPPHCSCCSHCESVFFLMAVLTCIPRLVGYSYLALVPYPFPSLFFYRDLHSVQFSHLLFHFFFFLLLLLILNWGRRRGGGRW